MYGSGRFLKISDLMFVFDFDKCISGYKTVEVFPKGWVLPLYVEYGIAQVREYDPQMSVVWRVKGSSHTFTIYENRLNIISNGDYKKHFELALTNFAKDYRMWFKDEEYEGVEWKYGYLNDIGRYILQEDDEDTECEDKNDKDRK